MQCATRCRSRQLDFDNLITSASFDHFSGIIHPVPADPDDKGAIWHLMTAYEIYRRHGDEIEADMVLGLLKRITNPGENPLRVLRLAPTESRAADR